jgi:hypothetical protein
VEINQELILLPDVIQCRRTGCLATKDVAWGVMSRDLHQQ